MASSSRIVLPVLDLEQGESPYIKKVLKGDKLFTTQLITPQSTSASSTSFSFQPPSQNTVIDRCIMLDANITVSTDPSGTKKLLMDPSSLHTPVEGRHTISISSYGFPKKRCTSLAFKNPVTTGTATVYSDLVYPAIDTAGRPLAAMDGTIQTGTDFDATHPQFLDISTGNNLCLRQFPLANCMQSVDVAINGTHFTLGVGELENYPV